MVFHEISQLLIQKALNSKAVGGFSLAFRSRAEINSRTEKISRTENKTRGLEKAHKSCKVNKE